jgi:serine/threonine protein kinase
MELLGNDMSTYRQIMRQNLFKYGYLYQLPLTVYLTKQMINCVEYVHSKGYVHRDIKPANFVRRNETHPHRYCIVDFGIAKQVTFHPPSLCPLFSSPHTGQHIDRDGRPRPERFNAEFRGTTMYASLNTHEDKDQSFRDDLWSVLFSFVDILIGQLPWSDEGKRKEKLLVRDLKREFTICPEDEKFTQWILDQIQTVEKEVSASLSRL